MREGHTLCVQAKVTRFVTALEIYAKATRFVATVGRRRCRGSRAFVLVLLLPWLASWSWLLLALFVLLLLGGRRRLVSLSLLPFGRRRGGLGGSSPPLVLVLLVGGLRPAVALPSSFPRLSLAACCVAVVTVIVIN